MRTVLALLVLLLGIHLGARGAYFPARASATVSLADTADSRELVRLEVYHADGSPYEGGLQLQCVEAMDAPRCSTNRYGLGFVRLLSGVEYLVSTRDYPQFARLSTVGGKGTGDRTVVLRLPTEKLRGKSAPLGKGLLIVTIKDKEGHPWAGQWVQVEGGAQATYSATTDEGGQARIVVPQGATYTISVEGLKAFAKHTFPKSDSLRTAEFTVDWSALSSRKPTGVGGSRERSVRRASRPAYPKRADSASAARQYVRRAKKQSPDVAFAIPPRPFTPTPAIKKNVITGISLLQEALQAEQQKETRYRNLKFEVLVPLMRNRWANAVYVVDVTCSMDPYVEQYLLWLSLAAKSSEPLGSVFFNDGDGLPDEDKVMGASGGIRSVGPEYASCVDTLLASISYGCSGDDPENDLEALLEAQARYPQAAQLVLIADSKSAVRDIELLSRLRKPVHVLLAGIPKLDAQNAPHPDYVSIAYATHGSLHTLEQDIALQKSALSGEQLQVAGALYRWAQGRFVRVK